MSTTINLKQTGDVDAWADRHHVHHEPLPFYHRKSDPVHQSLVLRNAFNEFVPTKQTWTLGNVDVSQMVLSGNHETRFTPLPYFLKSYRVRTGRTDGWTNPEYVHGVPLKPIPRETRQAHMLLCARTGVWSLSDVGRAWNVNKQTVQNTLAKAGYDWGAIRSKAQLRFARTMETINKWMGTPYAQLSRIFDVPRTTLATWRNRITEPIPTRPQIKR